ncbi:hypothetical protein BO70DRAFT_411443 [Aspergillus heteromorphus CBS 117.55]|uniref:Uncharacterized protein n=1 Tax=Aspergillus heteromorphus CBS 117.55 TaxID=1448321 RepID=A0A317VWN0_9EURO|nr:uncharacterized protein BO70DRAFT_411443 [Aspergillus heteromorphus CBS 117.55]PWY76330.1 hypothetical protein BO70DRAFT_411443 [Aspergillus heteromorphus CBS 117.55]
MHAWVVRVYRSFTTNDGIPRGLIKRESQAKPSQAKPSHASRLILLLFPSQQPTNNIQYAACLQARKDRQAKSGAEGDMKGCMYVLRKAGGGAGVGRISKTRSMEDEEDDDEEDEEDDDEDDDDDDDQDEDEDDICMREKKKKNQGYQSLTVSTGKEEQASAPLAMIEQKQPQVAGG